MKSTATAPAERVIPADVRQVIVRQLGAALAEAWRRANALADRDRVPTGTDDDDPKRLIRIQKRALLEGGR